MFYVANRDVAEEGVEEEIDYTRESSRLKNRKAPERFEALYMYVSSYVIFSNISRRSKVIRLEIL